MDIRPEKNYNESARQEQFDAEKQHFKETLSDRGNRFARSGRDVAAQEFGNIGNALHAAADRLSEQNDVLASWVGKAADSLDSAKNFLNEREPQDLMHDIQDFSKRNPYLTVGGMFAAGLALSRFFKAGSD